MNGFPTAEQMAAMRLKAYLQGVKKGERINGAITHDTNEWHTAAGEYAGSDDVLSQLPFSWVATLIADTVDDVLNNR